MADEDWPKRPHSVHRRQISHPRPSVASLDLCSVPVDVLVLVAMASRQRCGLNSVASGHLRPGAPPLDRHAIHGP